MSDQYLSIQDLFWRTMHGYVGLRERETGYNDEELISDLKSACSDVLGARAIGDYRDAFIPLNKNTISPAKLNFFKENYKKVLDYLNKNEASPLELERTLTILDSLIKEIKQLRKSNEMNLNR